MSWVQKLFGFHGRLNRRDFWLIMLGVVLVNWISILAFPDPFIPPALMSEEDPLSRAYAASEVFEANWSNAIVGVLLLWPALAASVKRCHDRNRSGVWLVAFWGPALVSGVAGDRGARALARVGFRPVEPLLHLADRAVPDLHHHSLGAVALGPGGAGLPAWNARRQRLRPAGPVRRGRRAGCGLSPPSAAPSVRA